jgi:hypothetical protein
LELELLEARNLLSFTNVLVNNPAEDTTTQDTQSESATVLGANAKLIVAFNDDFGSSLSSPTDSIVGYSVSSNGGASFQDQGTPPPGPNGTGTDPVLARSNVTGTVFLSTLQSDPTAASFPTPYLGVGVNVFRSTNNGVTFGQPINGAPGLVQGVDHEDKPWIAVDNNPGPGYGNVYLVWRDFSSASKNGILFSRSTDDGLTWGPSGGMPITTPSSNLFVSDQGAYVTVGPDHSVYVFWWDFNKGPAILMRRSTDQGQTFGDAVTVTGLKTHGGNGSLGLTDNAGRAFNTNAFPQAAVNPVTGDIYVVYNDEGNGSADKADVFFTESSDGGKHWSKPLRVNDDATNNDQWQPALAVTPDGSHVGIFWYDRRLDPANNLIDRFGVIGSVSNHNVTFAANFRITDVSFLPAFDQDPFFVNAGAGGYMGDYDMATADNNYFYTTWGDSRLADAFFANQPDVRFAKIPVTEEDAPTATAAPTVATQHLALHALLDPTLLLPITVSAMPATATAVTSIRPAPPAGASSPPAVPSTASVSYAQATDAPFAAAGQLAPNESHLEDVTLGTL